MLVETFETTEHVENHLEINEEQKKLINELGLSGQEDLIGESSAGMVCAYPEVTDEQSWIIKTICPKRYKVKDYKRTQIPLRVLQVISHVRQENYFKELYIFDKADEVVKDPFLVGCKGEYYNGTYHLLARWGEELLSWAELRGIASEMEKTRREAYAKKVKRTLDLFLDGEDIRIDDYEKPKLASWN